MSHNNYHRIYTPAIDVGGIIIGNNTPIKVQSMTNTDTLNTKESVAQIIRMINNGCELVRLTTRNIQEAENLTNIKNELKKQGFNIPLIADIHFNPKVAEIAAQHAEKIRINPGNYTDKKEFRTSDYSDTEYNNELDKIYDKIKPLITICKQYHTAIRIGVNHGSLSDRIISRYGDTPEGMVEAALEFARIIVALGFKNIVYSMKSSNTKIMVQATRMLAQKMVQESLCFPIHLGVTEAGAGEDGRIRSAIGIGTLINEGIGDTIRVSLTEPPEYEIPVAKSIIHYSLCINQKDNIVNQPEKSLHLNPLKRITYSVNNIGSNFPPVIIANYQSNEQLNEIELKKNNFYWNQQQQKWEKGDLSPDYLFIEGNYSFPNVEKTIIDATKFLPNKQYSDNKIVYVNNLENLIDEASVYDTIFLEIETIKLQQAFIEKIIKYKNVVIILNNKNFTTIQAQKDLISQIIHADLLCPIIIHNDYEHIQSFEDMQIKAAIDFGVLLTDGLINGIMITSKNVENSKLIKLGFNILQSAKARISKTEYISCPTCGRTQFNIMEVLEKVKLHTSHLKGLKIAVMGCVVNGPGEMADADYGYVGSGPGKVNLYKGKELIQKGINEAEALSALIEIIKKNGHWQDSNI